MMEDSKNAKGKCKGLYMSAGLSQQLHKLYTKHVYTYTHSPKQFTTETYKTDWLNDFKKSDVIRSNGSCCKSNKKAEAFPK